MIITIRLVHEEIDEHGCCGIAEPQDGDVTAIRINKRQWEEFSPLERYDLLCELAPEFFV